MFGAVTFTKCEMASLRIKGNWRREPACPIITIYMIKVQCVHSLRDISAMAELDRCRLEDRGIDSI